MSQPPEVEVDAYGRQVLALTEDGQRFRQYLHCSGGCGFLCGCGDGVDEVGHLSCLSLRESIVSASPTTPGDAEPRSDGFTTSLVLSCGCTQRINGQALPGHWQVGHWTSCINGHSVIYDYDVSDGRPNYDRDQRVVAIQADLDDPQGRLAGALHSANCRGPLEAGIEALLASPDLPTVCGSTWTAEQVAEFIHAAEEAGTLRRVIASEEFGIGRVHFSAWCPTEYRSASSTTEEGT